MLQKIEPNILKSVYVEGVNHEIDCVLLAGDYYKVKNKLNRNFKPIYYPFINAFGVKLNYKNMLDLASLNEVKYITQVSKVTTCVNVANKILNTSGHSNTLGAFTTVVIDTGIFPHLDFMVPRKKLIKFIDLVNGKDYPYDDNGHGTFVCGALCGGGTVSPKHTGIDPLTNLIVIKALDQNGETGANSILTAMQWVYENRKAYNIRLMCMSFGSVALGKNDPLMMGAEKLWDSGIVVVSAAGNSGPQAETIKSPGSSYKIITVGALDDKRVKDTPQYDKFQVADFSSRGPINNMYKPDVLASGVDVTGLSGKGLYTIMSGTSVSTPMVAGVCSRLIKQYPNYSPDRIKKLLISSCEPITFDRNSEGFGWINGEKLFN